MLFYELWDKHSHSFQFSWFCRPFYSTLKSILFSVHLHHYSGTYDFFSIRYYMNHPHSPIQIWYVFQNYTRDQPRYNFYLKLLSTTDNAIPTRQTSSSISQDRLRVHDITHPRHSQAPMDNPNASNPITTPWGSVLHDPSDQGWDPRYLVVQYTGIY